MEPGHEDREYSGGGRTVSASHAAPQWSPVMKTGNTHRSRAGDHDEGQASMEPGHEDREYQPAAGTGTGDGAASMEPGHEDREYPAPRPSHPTCGQGLNGARS